MRIDGSKLKRIRIDRGKSLMEIAIAAGYKHPESIRQIEHKGESGDINPHIVEAIAKFLKVTKEQLI